LNAVQAMGPGGVLSLKVEAVSDQMARVVISDNGPGIPEEVKARIFDPFFTTKSEGTGLGLSVSNSIIEDHNGKITLESKEGRGTTFYIALPIVREKEE
jgi:signal transduction histidine kinase